MSTHKHFNKICYAVLAVTLIITVLFMNGKALGIPVMASEDAGSDMFTANDLNSNWDTSNATKIMLSDNGSTINGNGAYVYDGDIYIAYAGQYIISGELSNGSLIISADSNDKIWLMLDGVSINCDDNSAIRVEQANKVFITLADETENTLTSGSEYNADAVSAGIDGVIYSRDDLTINGNGTLNITAEYQHGIVCNDDLVIIGSTIKADAVQDAIHANDSVRIKDAQISISAGDDGITVSNDDESAYLYIESGTINILSCYEGLEAIDITIAGGTIDIVSTDDGINANGSGDKSVINITGGNITITNPNGRDADGLDSNKDIYISGGNILISVVNDGSNSAIDYGTENGGVCEISGGTVVACGSSGMAEGFDSSSTQGFIMYNTAADAGTTVALNDSDGNELLSEEIPYSFSSVVISTPEMIVGDTCILTVGETKEEITIDNSTASSNNGQSGMPDRNMMGKDMRGGNPKQALANSENNENMISDNSVTQAVSDTQNEMPSDMPTPSDGENSNLMEQPNGKAFEDGMQPPEMPNNTDSDSIPPDFSQENDRFDGPHNEQNNNESDNTVPDSMRGNNSLYNEENTLSKENVIYLSVSFGVLLVGCIIALLFKKTR